MEPEAAFLAQEGLECMGTISHGAYGTVFKVYSFKYKRYFALKKIPMNQFKFTEIDCLMQIDDPKIVSLYKTAIYNNDMYLLMELCTNDLETVFKNRYNLSPKQVSQYIYEAISAVKACHDRNIAHCDIKPSNFLIDQYGRVKIADFGLSKILKDCKSILEFGGTKHYMAPEIFYRREFNPMQADIWSLGVTIYHFVSGCYPFDAEDIGNLRRQIERGIYCDDCIADRLLAKLIAKCLVYKPEGRAKLTELLEHPYFQQFVELHDCFSFSSSFSGSESRKLKKHRNSSVASHTLLSLQSLRPSRISLLSACSKSTETFQL